MALEAAYKLFSESAKETQGWLFNELATVRSGRVTPGMVEAIPVEHYGARTPLNGLASVSNLDARTLLISPWDASATQAIEKALSLADIGVQPTVDGKNIRLGFPMLSEEMREETVKVLHKTAEQAKVRLRQARDEALSRIKHDKQEGDITEDDFYNGKRELDSRIDKENKEIDEQISKKEIDIRKI